MVRSEVNINMSERFPHWPADDVAHATKLIFEIMTQSLVEGNRIELRGFGTFEIRERAAKMAQNPRTRKQVAVGKRGRVHFKPGRAMRKAVDASKQRFPIKVKQPAKPIKEKEAEEV